MSSHTLRSLLLVPLLSLLCLIGSTQALPHRYDQPEARKEANLKRDENNARMTYYYTDSGPGACGTVHSNNEWTVAISSAQWNGGSQCGTYISISYQGKTASALVADECPSCAYAELDLSPGLFNHFADESQGEFYGAWHHGQ